MQKRTSAAEPACSSNAGRASAMRVVIVTMDSHLAGAAARASRTLTRSMPGLKLEVHAAAEWGGDAAAL